MNLRVNVTFFGLDKNCKYNNWKNETKQRNNLKVFHDHCEETLLITRWIHLCFDTLWKSKNGKICILRKISTCCFVITVNSINEYLKLQETLYNFISSEQYYPIFTGFLQKFQISIFLPKKSISIAFILFIFIFMHSSDQLRNHTT